MRLGLWALVGFAALLGFQAPGPPLPGHAAWADPLVPLAVLGSTPLLWRERRALLSGPLLLALAYLAWAALSAAWRHDAGAWKVVGIGELVAVLAVASAWAGERRTVVRAWIVGSAVLCVIGLVGSALSLAHVPSVLYSARGGDLGYAWRPKGVCTTSNMLACICLVPLWLLVSVETLFTPRWRRLLGALLAVTFALTLSRSLLALAAGLSWRLLPRGRRAVVPLLLLASVASMRLDIYHDAGGWAFAPSEGLRWRTARSSLESFRREPLFGVGPGTEPAFTPWPRPDSPPTTLDAHSTLFNLLGTLGLPGALAFLALCGGVLRNRAGGALGHALAVGLLLTLFDGLTVDVEDFRHVWLLLGLSAPRPDTVRPDVDGGGAPA